MYASPLFLESGPGGKGVFLAVTANNDVFAIDAVTGADANMAADVNYLNEGDNGTSGEGNASASRTSAKSAPTNAATDEAAPATSTQNSASADSL